MSSQAALPRPPPTFHPHLPQMSRLSTAVLILVISATPLHAQRAANVATEVDAAYPKGEALYVDLHKSPELSFHETATAARIASELRTIGFDVTTAVGGNGIVAVMKNGAGPTVLLRT